MSQLTRNDLKSLSEPQSGGVCISLYIPFQRTGPEVRQNPIHLKNVLHEVEEELQARNIRGNEARELLQPAYDLLRNDLYWQERSEGLALFIGRQSFRDYKVPQPFTKAVKVDGSFFIKPLLKLFTDDHIFYLLTLSQNEARFYTGDPTSLTLFDVPGLPSSMSEALKFEEKEDLEARLHIGSRSGPGSGPTMFHGQGVSTHGDTKDRLLRYFHKIDQALKKKLRADRVPLIVAGVEYLYPIYKETNTYPLLLDGFVQGNPEQLSREELHRQAWEIARHHFDSVRDRAIRQYQDVVARERTSTDIQDILRAAEFGRVEILFVNERDAILGSYDPATKNAKVQPAESSESIDLTDLATRQTIMNNGTVYLLAPDAMPAPAPIAALFRY